MKLSQVYAEIVQDAKQMDVEGVVIILAAERGPVVIRTMPDDLAKQLLLSIANGQSAEEKMQTVQ